MTKELTPLQALEKVKMAEVGIVGGCLIRLYDTKQYSIIETALKDAEKDKKALDILKNKRIDIDLFIDTISYGLDEYNDVCGSWAKLTQEEYELLKEILK